MALFIHPLLSAIKSTHPISKSNTIIYLKHFLWYAGLHNLDSLGLAHNKLRKVPSRVFSHLALLNSLELEGNLIDTIDPEAFVGLDGK